MKQTLAHLIADTLRQAGVAHIWEVSQVILSTD